LSSEDKLASADVQDFQNFSSAQRSFLRLLSVSAQKIIQCRDGAPQPSSGTASKPQNRIAEPPGDTRPLSLHIKETQGDNRPGGTN
jgi:hypothetical protein